MSLLICAANLLVNWVFKCSDPGLCFCQCVLEAPTLKAIKVIYDLGRFIYTAYTTFINIWYPGFSVATRRSRRVKKLSEPCQGVRFSPTRSGNRTSFTMFYHEAWQKERRRSGGDIFDGSPFNGPGGIVGSTIMMIYCKNIYIHFILHIVFEIAHL